MHKSVVLLAILISVWLPVAGAADRPISGAYAGTVIDQLAPDGPFLLSEAEMKGAFGAARLSVLSQFVPAEPGSVEACGIQEVPLVMIYARSVTTFKDFSQLFVKYTDGWICASPGEPVASYHGWVRGTVVGGSGHFAGAGGQIESRFGGTDLAGPFVGPGEILFPGYGSFVGSMEGMLTLPE
jgi:hypothetical protein